MSRALASLKYVPAAVCWLLVVAWVVSLGVRVAWFQGMTAPNGERGTFMILLQKSTASIVMTLDGNPVTAFSVLPAKAFRWRNFAGLGLSAFWGQDGAWGVMFPIPFALTIVLPLTIGQRNRFRFPLWSYFAWTALLAAELAYFVS